MDFLPSEVVDFYRRSGNDSELTRAVFGLGEGQVVGPFGPPCIPVNCIRCKSEFLVSEEFAADPEKHPLPLCMNCMSQIADEVGDGSEPLSQELDDLAQELLRRMRDDDPESNDSD